MKRILSETMFLMIKSAATSGTPLAEFSTSLPEMIRSTNLNPNHLNLNHLNLNHLNLFIWVVRCPIHELGRALPLGRVQHVPATHKPKHHPRGHPPDSLGAGKPFQARRTGGDGNVRGGTIITPSFTPNKPHSK
jgi:hypothetical protein